ncbi:MAG: hypothetical protein H6Q68_376 [Firmicutes bacterium]|nr:hypothetical protein [Bacillota bacterium]
MQAVGIIVEYNPFHNGHKWHLDAAKKQSDCPFVIGVMSGNFMQRGEPAIFDKWKRAEMAIRGGVDLIIELPTAFVVRSAQYFATGGIRLLNSLGVVSHICFGAEHADRAVLNKIATSAENAEVIKDLHIHLQSGSTYAAALGKSLQSNYHISPDIITSPNDILAVEYLRAIEKFAPQLIPIPVTRQQSQYSDTNITAPFASATAIRHALLNSMSITDEISSAIPITTLNIIKNILMKKRGPVTFSNFSNVILAQLRTASLEKLEQLPSVSEGLHYKLRDSALRSANINQLFSLLKSKRYPYTRLQRIIIHSLLGTTKDQLAFFDEYGPLYARVLAFNQQGRILLKHINQYSNIPVITKTTHFLSSNERGKDNLTPLQKMLAIDTLASDIYSLGMPPSNWNTGAWDFRFSPLYLP